MLRQEKMDFARKAAADGIVLLKNENSALPIATNKEIALFGTCAYRCFRLGWGSGDMMAQTIFQINEGLKDTGYKLNSDIESFCLDFIKDWEDQRLMNRSWDVWTWRQEEIKLDVSMIEAAAKKSDVAVITLGRNSGEAFDLKDEAGYFRLHADEIELVKNVSKSFNQTILLLNTCGPLDLRDIDDCKIDALVDVSLGGEMFGYAVADVLSGKVTPNGKLTTTWAYRYEDYPTKEGITTKEVPYKEGIYVGYRYFDTFGVEPRYPFGYGLSYTEFASEISDVEVDGQIVNLTVKVTNIGKYNGREIIQCYLSSPQIKLEKAYQELCTYAKTDVLAPNECCELLLSFDLTEMASYDEERASFILEAGKYYVRVGNSSRNTHIACAININKEVICDVVKNRCVKAKDFEELSNKGATPYTYDGEETEKSNAKVIEFDCDSVETVVHNVIENEPVKLLEKKSDEHYTLKDIVAGKATVEDVVSEFSNEELADILNGVIYEGANANANVGSMAIKVRGAAGEMWSSEKYAIPVNACADGPAGVRLAIFTTPIDTDTELSREVVAYPSGTCMANSWDLESARRFGECVRDDLEISDIEGWLAPGINIHRNPLNGRNFEYLSEDPIIAGKIGAYITIGVQYNDDAELTGKYTTVKHFACNNIEYERGVSDSQMSERALREIYLKGFKIAVEEGRPHAIMTAYNKVNGVFASTNYDLLMGILRGEWDYDGIVMTDWNPCANPQEHVHACNDLIMPGRFRKQIIEGLENGNVRKEDAQLCAVRLIKHILKTNFKKNI
ncbi:MAG: glycoside hydrolase family 3 protein [Clostridia bacterium]|nr:glycoside hydrolase family 3 protein [Clostridia bacterium]